MATGHGNRGCNARRQADVSAMAKMRKKAELPEKVCATCGRPFAWRRKWAKVWDEVKYCSDRCRAARAGGKPS